MAVARVDEDDSILPPFTALLLTFWPRPLYKSCSGGREASVSMPYDRSYERLRSHGRPSFCSGAPGGLALHMEVAPFGLICSNSPWFPSITDNSCQTMKKGIFFSLKGLALQITEK